MYGCDICQDVCPWNQAAPVSRDPAWQPREGLDSPRLIDLWKRRDAELHELVDGSAMTRPKLTGLRRNIAVAMGNSRAAGMAAALDASGGPDSPSLDDPVVREHVAWARERTG